MTAPNATSKAAVGAAPEGARDEQSAARAVQQMFAEVAPRYDLLNHVLSCNVDRIWWWRAARTFPHILWRNDARVLDLCCGTGDMTLALRKRAGKAKNEIVGADFVHEMLVRAKPKTSAKRIVLMEADALQLPLPDGGFDLVTSAFGFRNLANYEAGLREIHRVLRQGGEIGILDFSEPTGVLGKLYRIYFRHVLPRVGGLISGQRGAYAYLPSSVERFPAPDEMRTKMQAAGFSEVSWTPYTFGIAGLFRGKKTRQAS
jgi:demethylmenaquinone methyltransferase / 2-methoxy-6-polyprenyl-1,4-benzoquinol methylase